MNLLIDPNIRNNFNLSTLKTRKRKVSAVDDEKWDAMMDLLENYGRAKGDYNVPVKHIHRSVDGSEVI